MARKASRKTAAAASADQTDAAPRHRFVVSQLLSLHATHQLRVDAAEIFSTRLEKVLLPVVDVVGGAPRAKREAATGAETLRRVLVIEGDPAELRAKGTELTSDTVIEPELPRVPAKAYPAGLQAAAAALAAPGQQGPGTGAELTLALQDPNGKGASGATVLVRFSGMQDPYAAMSAGGTADNAGAVSIAFDPNLWRPTLVGIEPAGEHWTAVVAMPQSGQTVHLQELPKTGPLGWWHLLAGQSRLDPDAGKNIKVGVVDSGAGPHPYLEHVTPIGAFIDGAFLPGAAQGRDVQTHGTHVSGIIGARPPADSSDFAGIAPGSDLYVGRIFTATGGGNQGDVANAIDALCDQYGADIINTSLMGAASSIEHDAIILAFQKGTLCVCAAGNQNGSAVGIPAAYPESIAVSVLGLPNTSPTNSMPAWNTPSWPDRFGYGSIFLASFSNIGPHVLCMAPGNGIISTIPASKNHPAPYADMSGTSMAAPLATGILANLLSRDAQYQAMPRNAARAAYAKALLARHALPIGLNPVYQGQGIARDL